MPDHVMECLLFRLPEGFDTLSREDKGRVLLHLLLEEVKRKKVDVVMVQGEYDGSGDSFDTSSLTFYGVPTDENMRNVVELTLDPAVHDALEGLMLDWVEDNFPGWETNDGGFGSMTIDLVDRAINFEHNSRYTSSEIAGSKTLFDDSEGGSEDET